MTRGRSTSTELIEDLASRIDDWLEAESRKPEVKASALRALREIGDDGEDLEILLSNRAKEEFLIDYLGVQKARFDADTPADIPEWVAALPWADAESVRTESLCDCNNKCQTKQARLSARVREAETVNAGVREEKQTHPGHPVALVEGNNAFNQRLADARLQLQTILSALSSNITVDELQESGVAGDGADDAESDADTTDAQADD